VSLDNSIYKKLSDEELILEFQMEKVEAFSELVVRYKDKLVNFLYRYTGDRDEAEDLAQDAFVKLYRSKHLYKEIAKFSTWFYTIAINTAKTDARKKNRYNTMSISDYDPENEKDYEIPANALAPDEVANASLEHHYIQKAIDSLEESFKEVIVLRDVEDLDYEEIAQVTGLPLGTVKSRINRGREKLKKILNEIYEA
jgi:RNA polymerase sigma-70 factor, ECF subfamily